MAQQPLRADIKLPQKRQAPSEDQLEEPTSKRFKQETTPSLTEQPKTPALMFEVHKTYQRCRAATITMRHGKVRTPVYMPVGTKGAMKGILQDSLSSLIDCDIMLANTYHLFLRPGEEMLNKFGGLHKYADWNRCYLTDSGGFQIVSLGALNKLDETGVTFQSHIDGQEFHLTPERSMEIQNAIGADIMMALDDVVEPTSDPKRVDEAMERSVRWLDRCIQAHARPTEQNLFGIIQGGVIPELRRKCCAEMIKRDLPGYAIGGLAGGEDKDDFWKTVKLCCELLPVDKPRYVMGIGYAEDLMVSALLGADMFDCVFATRTARFGSAITRNGMLKLRSEKYAMDFGPISEGCECHACQNYSRAYIQKLFRDKNDSGGSQLLSIHNVHFLIHMLRGLRQAVLEERVDDYASDFFENYFKYEEGGVPEWIYRALAAQKE